MKRTASYILAGLAVCLALVGAFALGRATAPEPDTMYTDFLIRDLKAQVEHANEQLAQCRIPWQKVVGDLALLQQRYGHLEEENARLRDNCR